MKVFSSHAVVQVAAILRGEVHFYGLYWSMSIVFIVLPDVEVDVEIYTPCGIILYKWLFF
jgi:hypothetical protein